MAAEKNSKYSSRIQCMSYYDKAHMDKLIKDVQLFCTTIFQFAPSKQQTSAYIHLISSKNVIFKITSNHYGLSMCTEWCPQVLTTVIIRLENRNEILGWLENRCRKEFLDDRNVIQEWIKSKYNDTLKR